MERDEEARTGQLDQVSRVGLVIVSSAKVDLF